MNKNSIFKIDSMLYNIKGQEYMTVTYEDMLIAMYKAAELKVPQEIINKHDMRRKITNMYEDVPNKIDK